MQGRNARVYAAVRRVPRGRVATYGDVAALAGLAGMARQVGYALAALPGRTTVPWHRVINARGEISLRRVAGPELEQRLRLEMEGVRFDARGRVSLATFGWPPARRRRPRRTARWS
jgi:methylated-DNA-protein-cysteine methyltransferase-like protein